MHRIATASSAPSAVRPTASGGAPADGRAGAVYGWLHPSVRPRTTVQSLHL